MNDKFFTNLYFGLKNWQVAMVACLASLLGVRKIPRIHGTDNLEGQSTLERETRFH